MFPYPFSFVSPQASGLSLVDNNFSMEFDSVDRSKLVVNPTLSFNLSTSSFSFNIWFNIQDYALGSFRTNYAFLTNFGLSPQMNFVYGREAGNIAFRRYGASSTQKPYFYSLGYDADSGGSSTAKTWSPSGVNQTGFDSNTWYMCTVVIESPSDTGGNRNKVSYYINGPNSVFSQNPFVLYSTHTSLGFTGLWNNIAASIDVYGIIVDETSIFNYALTSDDIKAIYDATNDNTGKTADLSSLATPPVAWYRMGD